MNTISKYNDVALIEACKIVAKTKDATPIFLPNFGGKSPVYAYIMKGNDTDSTFGFWYAGIIIEGTNNDTVLSITLIPQNGGNLIIAKTMVKHRIIKQLSIVKTMKASGISFGGINFAKMEVKVHYKALRAALFSSSTTLTLHDSLGRKLKVLSENQLPLNLPKTAFDKLLNDNNATNLSRISSKKENSEQLLYHVIDTAESNDRMMYQFLGEEVNTKDEESILNSEINGKKLVELSNKDINELENSKQKPTGIYIEVANQGGVTALSVVIMYSIDKDGNYHPIMYNQCSNFVKESFKETIRIKKKSGIFSSKVKIKRVLKVFSDIQMNCGEIKTATSLNNQRTLQNLELVTGIQDHQLKINNRSRTTTFSYLDSFENAIAIIITAKNNASLSSKFSKVDLGFYLFFLEERVRTPRLINQGPTSLCGPAAYFYLLASTNPEAYVKIAIALITKGEATYQNLFFEANPVMFNQEPIFVNPETGFKRQMNSVDWLTMSSLRHAENDKIWHTYNPQTDLGIAAFTTHWELASWLNNIENVKETTFSGALSMTKMNKAFHSGKSISLLVFWDLFKDGMPKVAAKNDAIDVKTKISIGLGNIFGNHYVVIDSQIKKVGDTYVFNIWTWGRIIKVITKITSFNKAVKKTFIIERI